MCLITVRASEANKRIVAQRTCSILCSILHDMEKSVEIKDHMAYLVIKKYCLIPSNYLSKHLEGNSMNSRGITRFGPSFTLYNLF